MNNTTAFNTTDKYRVTGPAVQCGGSPCRDVKTGDIITLDLPLVDGDGDVGVRGAGFILASSLTPVTEEAPDDDIRIPRTDLPRVVESNGALRVGHVHYVGSRPASERREEALHLLALAEFLEARESEAAAAEAKRDQRRDELARELSKAHRGTSFDYEDVGAITALAIDRIIELEAQVQA